LSEAKIVTGSAPDLLIFMETPSKLFPFSTAFPVTFNFHLGCANAVAIPKHVKMRRLNNNLFVLLTLNVNFITYICPQIELKTIDFGI
jgi:hypothetical protein